MEKAKLEAHFENRVYYFTITAKSADKLVINMYSTEYAFQLKDTHWENAVSNKNMMAQGLVDAVVEAAVGQ